MSILSPYLMQTGGRLSFRIRIPADVQKCLGKREYRRSLGYQSPPKAKPQALKLAAAAHEIFAFARSVLDARKGTDLTQPERKRYTLPDSDKGKSVMDKENQSGQPEYTPEALAEINRVVKGVEAREKAELPENQRQTRARLLGSNYPLDDSLSGRELTSLSDQEIRAIAEYWLYCALKTHNALRLELKGRSLEGDNNNDASEAVSEISRRAKLQYQEILKNDDMPRMHPAVNKQLALLGIERGTASTEPATLQYLKACQEMAKASVSFYDIMEGKARGDFSSCDRELERLEESQRQRLLQSSQQSSQQRPASSSSAANPLPTPEPEQPTGPNIREAMEEFTAEKIREKTWRGKTALDRQDKCGLFAMIVDPDNRIPVSKLNATSVSFYRAAMFGMPNNRNKKAVYRDMEDAKLIKLAFEGKTPESDRMANLTLRNHFQVISSFIGWCGAHGYIGNSDVRKLLTIKKDKQDHEYRDNYTAEEIKTLFDPEIYLKEGLRNLRKDFYTRPRNPNRFWLPLLGLFTGARLEELAQLHIDDIVTLAEGDTKRDTSQPFVPPDIAAAGSFDWRARLAEIRAAGRIPCFRIHEFLEDQHVKNPSSRRYFPIPPALIDDLGFLGYVAACHRRGEGVSKSETGRLFPELRKTGKIDKYSHQASKWFQQYRKNVGMKPAKGEARKDFHSFRHTIGQWCDNAGADEKVIGRHFGHAHSTITFKTYSSDITPERLLNQIVKPYSEHICSLLDIEALAKSPWAQL